MDEPVVIDRELPADLAEQIEDNRRHPERSRPRPARPGRREPRPLHPAAE